MNREIKFRVWDKKREKMGTVIAFRWSPALCVESVEYSYQIYEHEVYGGESKHGPCDVGRFLAPAESCEIMQFTGLFDVNGKEICEGDILILNPRYSRDTKVQVVYQAPSFVMKEHIDHKMWHEFGLSPEEHQFQEVIGNIYESENPEPTKEEKQ